MRLEVVPNKGPASLGPELSQGFSWARSVDIATAFLTTSSLELIEEALANACDSGRSLRIRLLCGLFQRFTSAATIQAAVRLQKNYPDQFCIRVAKNNRFHWKLYVLRSNSKARVYVGSANFTEDGLTASGELSVKITAGNDDKIVRSLQSEFDDIWGKKRSFSPDDKFLRAYRRLKRPPHIIRQPTDNPALGLLQEPERIKRKRHKETGTRHAPRAPRLRVRLICVADDLQPETKRLIKQRTNWDSKGWNYTCLYSWDYEPAKSAAALVYAAFHGRGADARLTLEFHAVKESVKIKTPDGNCFIAHSRIPYGRTRDYDAIKDELRKVGLSRKKLQWDRTLNQRQVQKLCELLRVSPERLFGES